MGRAWLWAVETRLLFTFRKEHGSSLDQVHAYIMLERNDVKGVDRLLHAHCCVVASCVVFQRIH